MEQLQSSLLKYFLKDSSINIVSCDKMMVRSKGPVWHQKQKKQNIIPERLHGVDRQATWGKSAAKGWVYGHGTFSIVTHDIPILGMFAWMPNSGNEAKRMEQEIVKYHSLVKIACMDSKADDSEFYFNLQKNYGMQLLTRCRKRMDKTPIRKLMIKQMAARKFKKIYQQRSTTVEPMQGLVDNIFDLETAWMRGEENNRWLFAAMGAAVQMAQLQAYKNHQSTWNIKSLVLGT